MPSAFAFGLFPFLPVSFVPDRSGFDYSALCSSFPFLPASASQWLPQCSALAFAPAVFPVLSSLISHAFLPGSGTQLPVRFLSSLPASLPQLFHRCFPSFPLSFVRFSSGLSPRFLLPFVRFLLGSDYSAFCSFFSLLPVFPWQRFLRCLSLSASPLSVAILRFRFGTQLSVLRFSGFRFRLAVATFPFLRFVFRL